MRRVARARLAAHTQADGEARALGGGDGGGDLLERVRLESDLQNDLVPNLEAELLLQKTSVQDQHAETKCDQ